MTLLSDGNEHRNFNNPPIWIPLFEITVAGETFYLTPNFDTITVDGHDYTPFPITLDELVEDGQGEVSTVKLALSTIDNTGCGHQEGHILYRGTAGPVQAVFGGPCVRCL